MRTLLIATAMLLTGNLFSQHRRYFTFADTTFSPGQTHRLALQYVVARPELDSASLPCMDSVAAFLNKNKALSIEIAVHGKSTGCMAITASRSKQLADALVARGIDPKRLFPVGYGEKKPLISEQEVMRAATKEEKEYLMSLNRRTEIIIK